MNLEELAASHESLHAKIDRIVAAIDEHALAASSEAIAELERRIATLERENAELKSAADLKAQQSSGGARKTLPPFVSMLLTKSGLDDPTTSSDSAVLDKALASLSVEQRVAVKAEMARAGIIA